MIEIMLTLYHSIRTH